MPTHSTALTAPSGIAFANRPRANTFLGRFSVTGAWPATLLIVGYPFFWLAGLGAFVWVVFPLVMALALASRRRIFVPPGSILWALFCMWVVISGTQIDTAGRMAAFALRTGYYFGAGAFLLFLMNGGRTLDVPKILRLFSWLWIATIAGGLLGVFLPNLSYQSPLVGLLPSFLTENEFVKELTTTGFAEVQNIVGVTIPRPKAPYAFTNAWGGAVGLLFPLAIAALAVESGRLPRRLLRLSLPIAIIPILLSLNRGLWISLVAGLLYVSLRQARRGNGQVTAAIMFVVLFAAALLLYTPLGEQALNSLETRADDSDQTRSALIIEAVDRSFDSPLLGYGGPRDSLDAAVPVGTHGQLWTLIFSHGFVATGLYLGFFGIAFYVTRNPLTTTGLWAHAVIVVGGIQMLFYGQLPHQLFIMMGAVAVAMRESEVAPRPFEFSDGELLAVP